MTDVEPASPVPAPTPDGQRDAESRERSHEQRLDDVARSIAWDMTGERLAAMSRHFDASLAGRDPEAILWQRVGKVAEEAGEVIEALIGATAGNVRKGRCRTTADVRKELLDVAVTALCAIEHLDGNAGRSLGLLAQHATFLVDRLGLDATAVSS